MDDAIRAGLAFYADGQLTAALETWSTVPAHDADFRYVRDYLLYVREHSRELFDEVLGDFEWLESPTPKSEPLSVETNQTDEKRAVIGAPPPAVSRSAPPPALQGPPPPAMGGTSSLGANSSEDTPLPNRTDSSTRPKAEESTVTKADAARPRVRAEGLLPPLDLDFGAVDDDTAGVPVEAKDEADPDSTAPPVDERSLKLTDEHGIELEIALPDSSDAERGEPLGGFAPPPVSSSPSNEPVIPISDSYPDERAAFPLGRNNSKTQADPDSAARALDHSPAGQAPIALGSSAPDDAPSEGGPGAPIALEGSAPFDPIPLASSADREAKTPVRITPAPAGTQEAFNAFDLVQQVEDKSKEADTESSRATEVAPLSVLEQRMSELMELDDLTGTRHLAKRILTIDPDHSGALAAEKRARDTLLKMAMSKIGDMNAVPTVLCPPDQVIWLDLDHRSGFILSQVDGISSYQDIMEIAGMDHYECATILAGLVNGGVIGLRGGL